MDQLIELALFTGKLVLVFLFIVGVVSLIAGLAARNKMKPHLDLIDINDRLAETSEAINSVLLDKRDYKKYVKDLKRKLKEEEAPKKRVFVLNFDGDVQADGVTEFREEVTAVLTVAQPGDEVVVLIESAGGTVHGYGLCAAQILRLRDHGLEVTACVDKVAASGGYMMAVTANKVIAAPFAILGSIGVLAQVPNLHRLLKRHDIDYEELSAGEYKRTISVFGEITDKGRTKFLEQIEDTHVLFKEFVSRYRPQVDLSKVATGEYWFALRAKDLQLIDEICTSDEYLLRQKETARIFSLRVLPKRTLADKLEDLVGRAMFRAGERALRKIKESRLL